MHKRKPIIKAGRPEDNITNELYKQNIFDFIKLLNLFDLLHLEYLDHLLLSAIIVILGAKVQSAVSNSMTPSWLYFEHIYSIIELMCINEIKK